MVPSVPTIRNNHHADDELRLRHLPSSRYENCWSLSLQGNRGGTALATAPLSRTSMITGTSTTVELRDESTSTCDYVSHTRRTLPRSVPGGVSANDASRRSNAGTRRSWRPSHHDGPPPSRPPWQCPRPHRLMASMSLWRHQLPLNSVLRERLEDLHREDHLNSNLGQSLEDLREDLLHKAR